jgi:hypothetical protein
MKASMCPRTGGRDLDADGAERRAVVHRTGQAHPGEQAGERDHDSDPGEAGEGERSAEAHGHHGVRRRRWTAGGTTTCFGAGPTRP